MNKNIFRMHILIYLLLSALWLFPAHVGGGQEHLDVRPSVIAGTWYPGTPDTLTKSIEGYLSRVMKPRLEGELKAVIVPHAGYVYSGQVAAHAYRLLEGKGFKRVILVGPSHYVGFEGVSVNLQSGYKTPFGVVPIDQEMGNKILETGPPIRWLRRAHDREHAIEIQLPFLQKVLYSFQIVPIIMGQQDYHTCQNLANTIAYFLRDRQDTLLLASSDLSHFHPYKRAKALDFEFIKYVREFDPEGLAKALATGKCEACGGGPVIATMLTARKLGAGRAIILNYANSGDVTGSHRSVVGYLSAAITR